VAELRSQLMKERVHYERLLQQVQLHSITATPLLYTPLDNSPSSVVCLIKSSTVCLTVLQVFAHTNDLNVKDDMIAHLRMREASLEGLLAANDRMHEQDAIVRLQLGKRLEQVLLDKEEAYEELDLFKVKKGSARPDVSRLHGRMPLLPSGLTLLSHTSHLILSNPHCTATLAPPVFISRNSCPPSL
jgi:hypothetical protein